MICGIIGLVYAGFLYSLVASASDYDGCKICGTTSTRPEWFEFWAVLIHGIFDLVLAFIIYNEKSDDNLLAFFSGLEGVVEFLIGLFGLFLRWPGCDVVFPVLMGIMGLDKLVHTLYEADVLSGSDGSYICCEVIVLICCAA